MVHAQRGVSLVLVAALLALACAKQDQPSSERQDVAPIDRRAADESAIRATDSAWVKAIASKDANQAASYYTEDAVLMVPGLPMFSGRDAVGKGWASLMTTPGFALTFAPDRVTVNGDMAFEVGTYEMTMNGKNGKPQTTTAKYAVVWARQPDGSWKAKLDAPTTTQ